MLKHSPPQSRPFAQIRAVKKNRSRRGVRVCLRTVGRASPPAIQRKRLFVPFVQAGGDARPTEREQKKKKEKGVVFFYRPHPPLRGTLSHAKHGRGNCRGLFFFQLLFSGRTVFTSHISRPVALFSDRFLGKGCRCGKVRPGGGPERKNRRRWCVPARRCKKSGLHRPG